MVLRTRTWSGIETWLHRHADQQGYIAIAIPNSNEPSIGASGDCMDFHGDVTEKDPPWIKQSLLVETVVTSTFVDSCHFSDIATRRSQFGSVPIYLCIYLHKLFISAKRIQL